MKINQLEDIESWKQARELVRGYINQETRPRTVVIDLSESVALLAADLSIRHALPMADAIVYASALESNCRVVTGHAHFRGLEGVFFIS